MLTSMRNHGLTLALFALVCTSVVVATHLLTQDKIAHQQQREKLNTLSALLPVGSYDNDLVASCKRVSSPLLGTSQPMPLYTATLAGQVTGYAMETVAPDGYSGAIRLIVGTDAGGKVQGVRVLAHNETPGLGDKIELKKSDWIESFVGKFLTQDNEASWAVKKDGGDFDAFTGATITPRAVVKAVANLLRLQQTHPALLQDAPPCDGAGENP
ncbi:electron transport complex subunit RsxG [Aeromonas sobria]|uniref:electron transport complex subunit RsxG n=1 Tax=Aeromonas sobria TaxID=646 RepID=UPI003D0710B6